MTTPDRTTPTTITTLLALPPDLVERDRVRRQALRVAGVRHAGLAPLREVAFAGEGLALTWEVQGEGLPDGEAAVAALAPVAAGLALLHDAGLAHGGICREAIRVHEARGALSGWRPGGSAERDVSDLIGLLDACLPPASVGADIAQLVIAGADPDPASRPSMASVAATLERAATHVVLHPSPPAHRRARPSEAALSGPAEPAAAPVGLAHVASRRPDPTPGRGRHARRALAGNPRTSLTRIRLPWRWGVAAAGAVAAAFLGFSALGSAGSAQEICPAVPATSVWSSLVQQAVGG